MKLRPLHLPFVLLLALGVATGAHAQSKPQASKRDPAVLPVLGALSEIYCPQLAGSSRPQTSQGDPS